LKGKLLCHLELVDLTLYEQSYLALYEILKPPNNRPKLIRNNEENNLTVFLLHGLLNIILIIFPKLRFNKGLHIPLEFKLGLRNNVFVHPSLYNSPRFENIDYKKNHKY